METRILHTTNYPVIKHFLNNYFHIMKRIRSGFTWTFPFITIYNIVAAFWGMHVSPAKHIYSYAWLPRKCDYWTDAHTDGQTDREMPDKVIPMCRYASQATQKPSQWHRMASLISICCQVKSTLTDQLLFQAEQNKKVSCS